MLDKNIMLLNEILGLSENTMIRFNQLSGNSDPKEEYTRNPSIVNDCWFFLHKEQRYFKEGQIFGRLIVQQPINCSKFCARLKHKWQYYVETKDGLTLKELKELEDCESVSGGEIVGE